jgi:hypothetical protein
MKVASVTVIAMTQGLARGRHVSWKEGVAADASASPFLELLKLAAPIFGAPARFAEPASAGESTAVYADVATPE